MALDKLVDSTQLNSDLTSVANAIRTKGGTSASLAFPAGFVSAIDAIPTGGGAFDFADLAWPTGTIITQETSIFRACFGQRTGIERIEAPNAISASDEAFRNCTGLKSVYVPKLEAAFSYCFESCTSLVGIALPSLKNVPNKFLTGCTALEYVDYGDLTGSGAPHHQGDTYNNCTAFKMLVIRKASVVPIPNVNSFNGTPFASGGTGGTIYVPNSLMSSYQSASNWSTILGYANNQIKSIESTHTDPNAPIDLTLYYADGTLIPT